MATIFTIPRVTWARVVGVALFAGISVGAVGASFTVANARLGDRMGIYASASFADLAGNRDAIEGTHALATDRCRECGDTYDISYGNDPDRPRLGARVSDRGWNVAETGWGAQSFADTVEPSFVPAGDAETGRNSNQAARDTDRHQLITQSSRNMQAALAATAEPATPAYAAPAAESAIEVAALAL